MPWHVTKSWQVHGHGVAHMSCGHSHAYSDVSLYCLQFAWHVSGGKCKFCIPVAWLTPEHFCEVKYLWTFFSEIFLGDFLWPIFGKLFSSKLHDQIGTFSGVDFLRSLPNRDTFGHIAITSQVAITWSKWQYLASGNGDLLASNGHIKSHSYLPINHHYLRQDMAIYWQVLATQNKSALLAVNSHILRQIMMVYWQVMGT